MEKISEIKNFVKKKKCQGFEGYIDMLEYFNRFSLEQLYYIEISLKTEVESSKRLSSYREIVTLFVAILALIVACVPEQFKGNANHFALLLSSLLMNVVLAFSVYCFLSTHTSKVIDLCRTALKVIAKVKNNRQGEQFEQINKKEGLTK